MRPALYGGKTAHTHNNHSEPVARKNQVGMEVNGKTNTTEGWRAGMLRRKGTARARNAVRFMRAPRTHHVSR